MILNLIFRMFNSERDVTIHEAGHLLQYVKYLAKQEYSERHFKTRLKKAEFICAHPNGGFCSFRFPFRKNQVNITIRLGGIAAELSSKNKHIDFLSLIKHIFINGCAADIRELQACGLSNKDIIKGINEQIDELSASDKSFIYSISELLLSREKKTNKRTRYATHFIENNEIFSLCLRYYQTNHSEFWPLKIIPYDINTIAVTTNVAAQNQQDNENTNKQTTSSEGKKSNLRETDGDVSTRCRIQVQHSRTRSEKDGCRHLNRKSNHRLRFKK